MLKALENIEFVLIGIKTEQFAIFEEFHNPKKEVNLTAALEFKISSKNRNFAVFGTFQFEQGKNTFIKLVVSCHFNISEKSWNTFVREDSVVIPVDFSKHLSILTIGTARGILHAKTEGTSFNTFLLPAIDIHQIVKDDSVFKMNS